MSWFGDIFENSSSSRWNLSIGQFVYQLDDEYLLERGNGKFTLWEIFFSIRWDECLSTLISPYSLEAGQGGKWSREPDVAWKNLEIQYQSLSVKRESNDKLSFYWPKHNKGLKYLWYTPIQLNRLRKSPTSTGKMPDVRLSSQPKRLLNAVVVSSDLMQKTVKVRVGKKEFNKLVGKVRLPQFPPYLQEPEEIKTKSPQPIAFQ